MVPVPVASGAMGSGRYCGDRTVCADNSVSGHLCSAVRMLRPKRKEAEEEAEEGWGDLDI